MNMNDFESLEDTRVLRVEPFSISSGFDIYLYRSLSDGYDRATGMTRTTGPSRCDAH